LRKSIYLFKEDKIYGEIVIVDDNSPDGTGKNFGRFEKEAKKSKELF